MISIIQPSQFNTIPWKNGQGETTELAINDNASLDDFTWRLSIASVVNNGVFSDFSGYYRNLVLIEGMGISLQHDGKNIDMLKNLLDVASFEGSCKTQGSLVNGSIKDFNIITDNDKVTAQVHCYTKAQQVKVELSKSNICFAYSISDDIKIEVFQNESTVVPVGHLLKLSPSIVELAVEKMKVTFTGENMIIVQLELKKY